MEDLRKFLINLSTTDDLKATILEFLHETLTLLLHSITATLKYLHEKLPLLLHSILAALSALSQQLDRIWPPETRSETIHPWIRLALPVLLVGFVVLKCCGRRSGGYGKMMAAPGRGGAQIPRASFEASPRDYFANLRARKASKVAGD